MNDQQSDKGKHVYSAERRVDTTLRFVENQMTNPRVGFKALFPSIQNKLDRWKAGDLIGLLAYTSNGKSSVAWYIANQLAYQLRSAEDLANHVVVYFTWEQPIELQTSINLGNVSRIPVSDIMDGRITPMQFKNLQRIGESQKTVPIWIVGHSIQDDETRPMLSIPDCRDILIWIENECGMVVELVVLDYLQRVRRLLRDLREGYMQICDDSRTMAMKRPVLLLSQAKREVFERKWSMPQLNDAQETSNFEQSCTHMHGLWMPKQNKLETIKLSAREINVQDNLLLMEVLKQTLGPTMFTTPYEIGYGGTYMREWGAPPDPEPLVPQLF